MGIRCFVLSLRHRVYIIALNESIISSDILYNMFYVCAGKYRVILNFFFNL